MKKDSSIHGYPTRISFSKGGASAIVLLVGLTAILLLTSCIFMWKLSRQVKSYEVKVRKFTEKADELIIQKEKVHQQRNQPIHIQGFIRKEGLAIYPSYSRFGRPGTYVCYYKVINMGLVDFKHKDTLSLIVNEEGNFVATIPRKKAFLSQSVPMDSKGISIANENDIRGFLNKALVVKVLMTRPPKHYVDSLRVDFEFLNLNDTLTVYTPQYIFGRTDSVNYDRKRKLYKVYITNRTMPRLADPSVGLEVLILPKGKEGLNMGIQ